MASVWPDRITITFPRSEEQRLAFVVTAMHCHEPISFPDHPGLYLVTRVGETDGVVTVEASRWTMHDESSLPAWLATLTPEAVARINAIPATGPMPWDIADGALAEAIAGPTLGKDEAPANKPPDVIDEAAFAAIGVSWRDVPALLSKALLDTHVETLVSAVEARDREIAAKDVLIANLRAFLEDREWEFEDDGRGERNHCRECGANCRVGSGLKHEGGCALAAALAQATPEGGATINARPSAAMPPRR